jgi:ABC-type sulfate transport system permease subunit
MLLGYVSRTRQKPHPINLTLVVPCACDIARRAFRGQRLLSALPFPRSIQTVRVPSVLIF